MNPDRWAEIERVCHGASARPAGEREAFLRETCVGDEALRREVESLLAAPGSREAFLAEPTILLAAQLVNDPGTSMLTGHRIGAYQVQALLCRALGRSDTRPAPPVGNQHARLRLLESGVCVADLWPCPNKALPHPSLGLRLTIMAATTPNAPLNTVQIKKPRTWNRTDSRCQFARTGPRYVSNQSRTSPSRSGRVTRLRCPPS
jgi:hypothetical protein